MFFLSQQLTNLMHKILLYNKFISCLYMFRTPCAHHQEVKIALQSLWYQHTYRCEVKGWGCFQFPMMFCVLFKYDFSIGDVLRTFQIWLLYRCDDTRGCIMQSWPPDDEHMCSKHVEAWNKLIVKQQFFVSSWLITEINILRCAIRKTSKSVLNSETNIPRCTVSKTIHILRCTVSKTINIARCTVRKR